MVQVEQRSDALVVKDVRAGSNEQGLTDSDGKEADAAVGHADTLSVGGQCSGSAARFVVVGRREWIALQSTELTEGIYVVLVGLALPAAVEFDAHLDTAIDFFGASLIIDTELNHVSVLDGERFGFKVRSREANVVEKSS